MLDRILIGSSAEPSDPNFKNVTLLLHGDGSNGAQNNTFIDSSTNNFTITRNGNTTQGSFSPYGSNWSCVYDGSGDYNRISSNETALQFGTGDFTIEGWVFSTNGTGTFQQILTGGTSWTSGSGGVYWYYNGGSPYIGAAWNQVATNPAVNSGTLATNTWHHFAFVRSGNTLTLYVNGTSVDTLDVTGTSLAVNNQSQTNIGGGGWDQDFAGYLSNLRVLKGTALYTSNFTPSTTPLTAITNTSLLTCAYNRFRDGSTNNFTITRNGDVKVTNFAPFAPSAAYSTTTNGGSAYFDGSGDYLAMPSNAAFGLGSGDFTVECWVNPSVQGGHGSSNNDCIIDFRPGSNGAYGTLYIVNNGSGVNWYANTAVQITGGPIPNNAWTHLAVSRVSGNTRLFINGVQSGGTYSDGTTYATTNPWIGQFNDGAGSGWFQGYISNFRILKGTGLYSGSFTPPAAPLTAVTNTQFLLNATNAAIFDNSMKNDLETVGNAQISTSVKKFGTGSIAFDGNGDGLLGTNSVTSFDGGNFTWECWLNLSALSGVQCVLAVTQAPDRDLLHISSSSGANFVINRSGVDQVSVVQGSTSGWSTGVWYHVAVVRNGNVYTIYRDGVSIASTTSSYAKSNLNAPITVGYSNYSASYLYLNGYVDEVRITNGVARYTSNFTAPTAPFPNK